MAVGLGVFVGVKKCPKEPTFRREVIVDDVIGTQRRAAQAIDELECDLALAVKTAVDHLGAHLSRGIGEIESEVVRVPEIREELREEARSLRVAQRGSQDDQAIDMGIEDVVEAAQLYAFRDGLDHIEAKVVRRGVPLQIALESDP